jgi:hypothetical protein
MPVVVSVLLLRPIFFFSYFCRCVSALAVNIVVTSGEVGLKEGHGGWTGDCDIKADGSVWAGVIDEGWG